MTLLTIASVLMAGLLCLAFGAAAFNWFSRMVNPTEFTGDRWLSFIAFLFFLCLFAGTVFAAYRFLEGS